MGKIRTNASVIVDRLALPVAKAEKFMHFAGFLYQVAPIGTHLNTVETKIPIIMDKFIARSTMIAIFTFLFCPLNRHKNRRMEVLISARIGLYRIST